MFLEKMMTMRTNLIELTEVEDIWESMSDSQREIFQLGFHIGRKLAIQEAQEGKKPNLPNKGENK